MFHQDYTNRSEFEILYLTSLLWNFSKESQKHCFAEIIAIIANIKTPGIYSQKERRCKIESSAVNN